MSPTKSFISVLCALSLVIPVSASHAQRKGRGGTGVNKDTELPICDRSFGIAALVEDKPEANGNASQTSGNLALLAQLAREGGGQTARVDPLPLIRLMASKSRCFQLVERGAAQSALERERALAGIKTRQVTADYLITAKVVYSNTKARRSGGILGGVGRALGGSLGGVVGSAISFKSKTAEAEVLLALIEVETGLQMAISSGSARKRDAGIFGGGILGGFGAVGGTYGSTDIGKVTAIAALDAYINLVEEAKISIPKPEPVIKGAAVEEVNGAEPCAANTALEEICAKAAADSISDENAVN